MNKLTAVAATLCLVGAMSSHAQTISPAVKSAIQDGLKKNASIEKIDAIRPTPVPGLYEVQTGKNILYSNEDGRYIFDGHLVDAKEKTDLTQKEIDRINKINFAKLPFSDAIKITRGDGSRKLAIFEDPNCGYCKKLEAELLAVNDITIYVFLIPILGSDSAEKSNNIWCSANKEKAWSDWMVGKKAPQARNSSCDTSAVQRNSALAKEFSIQGTPAIFFEDGSRVPGAISAAQINAKLSQK